MTDPQDVLYDGAETYEDKQEDYGDSWRKGGEILWKMAGEEPIVLESAEDCIRYSLYTRRLDKIIRAFNGEFVADDLNFESIFDSHADEGVYAAMHASLNDGEAVSDGGTTLPEDLPDPEGSTAIGSSRKFDSNEAGPILGSTDTENVTGQLQEKEWINCPDCGSDGEVFLDDGNNVHLHCPKCNLTQTATSL